MSKKLLLLLVLATSSCWASFTFTTPGGLPFAVNLSHTGARILSSTSVPTNSYVVWDTVSHWSASCIASGANPCASYPNYESPQAYHGVFNWFIGGVPLSVGGTPVYFRVCATDGTSTSCSREATFTTLPQPVPHPALAILPQTTPTPTVPIQTGTTRTIGVTTGCTDPLACWNISSCGDTIVVRAAVPVIGNWALPIKTCSPGSQLLIETDQVASLPPARTQITPASLSSVASLEPSIFSHYLYTTVPTNGNCHPGGYLWLYSSANTPSFNMQQCVQNPATPLTITNVTGCVSAGNGNLGACSVTTSSANNFSAANGGDIVWVQGVVGVNKANGTCRVTSVTSPTVFVMTCSAGYVDPSNTYISGGTVQNHVWSSTLTPQSVTLGAAPTYFPPAGACSPEGAWGYDASHATQNYDPALGPILGTTSTGSVVRCVQDESGSNLVWRQWTVWLNDPTTSPQGEFTLDLSGSSWIYVLGVRLASQRIPPEPLWLRDGGYPEASTAIQGGHMSASFINTSVNSSNITFDRCIVDGIDYPRGMVSGVMRLNGNNISIVDSYITGISLWFSGTDRGPRYDDYASAALIRSGGTGFLLRNNYIEAGGITMHFDDSESLVLPIFDNTIVRNTFYRNPAHFYGSNNPLFNCSLNCAYYPFRQVLESKASVRELVDGNTFTNNWRNVSAGTALQLSPLSDSSPYNNQYATISGGNTIDWGAGIPVTNLAAGNWLACAIGGLDQLYQVAAAPTTHSVTVASIANGVSLCVRMDYPYGITDVTFSNNTFTNFPNGLSTFGVKSAALGSAVQNFSNVPLQRITLLNNLWNGILDDNPIGGPSGTTGDPNIWQSNGGGYGFSNPTPFGFDIISDHETYVGVGGVLPAVFGIPPGQGTNTDGISLTNGVYSMRDPATCPVPANCTRLSPINAGGASGSAMMARVSAGTYSLANGLYQMAGGSPGGYPASISWLSNVSQFNFSADYRLGSALGANMIALNTAQGQVSNVVGSVTAPAIVDAGSPSDTGYSTPATCTSGGVPVACGTTAYTLTSPTPLPILPPGTSDMTMRYGPQFTYHIQVAAPGTYTVLLNFVEPTVTGPGQRVFSVWANDQPILQDLDLYAESGYMVPTARAASISIAGTDLYLMFSASIRNAVISSIAVSPGP